MGIIMVERFSAELMRGSLDLLVLSVLMDGPQYGYRIGQQLRKSSRELVNVPAGTLYPLLHRLEGNKLIRSKWDDSTGRRRKWYELTAAGRKRLQSQAQEWHSYVECIGQLLSPIVPKVPKPV